MKKSLLFIFLASLGLFGLYFSYSKRSSCFSPSFALAQASFHQESSPPSLEIKQILAHPFHFLGSGNQSFAFESQDQKWVLKLFKFHCLYGFDFYDLLPSIGKFKELKAKHALARQKRVDRLMEGLLIANRYPQANSGIIYLHFPKTLVLDKKVIIQDKAFRTHSLDLADYVFVLQQKAVPLSDVLTNLLQAKDVVRAKESLKSFFDMIRQGLEAGLYDQDHNVMANTGFAMGLPIRIDFGKLTLSNKVKDPHFINEELTKIKQERILPWMQKHFPEYKTEIDQAFTFFVP